MKIITRNDGQKLAVQENAGEVLQCCEANIVFYKQRQKEIQEFEQIMNKRNWDDEEYRQPKRDKKKGKKNCKCPYCGREVKSYCSHCDAQVGKRKY